MAKAPFSLDAFDSSDTLDLGSLGTSETNPPDAQATKIVEDATKAPKKHPKTVSEVARSTIRKQKAERTEQPKYMSIHISPNLDRRLKQIGVDEDIKRQEMGVEALEDYCKKMEPKS